MNFVDSLNMFGVNAKEIPCIKGNGAPSAETVGEVGLLYMDVDTGVLYKCVGVEWHTSTGNTEATAIYTWNVLIATITINGRSYNGTTAVDFTAALNSLMREQLLSSAEQWEFTLDDGTIVKKKVVVIE